MGRALRLGITGKIGSGKSTFSQTLRERNIEVIDTDSLAKKLMNSDAKLQKEIKRLFGESAYEQGELNRSFIASVIFTDSAKREALEALVHPAVSDHMEIAFSEGEEHTIIGVESALVFQTELWRRFDYIVLVTAEDTVVIERASRSSSLSKEDIQNRLSEQNYQANFRDEADFMLENNGSLPEFKKRCEFLATVITSLRVRSLPPDPLHSLELEDLSQA